MLIHIFAAEESQISIHIFDLNCILCIDLDNDILCAKIGMKESCADRSEALRHARPLNRKAETDIIEVRMKISLIKWIEFNISVSCMQIVMRVCLNTHLNHYQLKRRIVWRVLGGKWLSETSQPTPAISAHIHTIQLFTELRRRCRAVHHEACWHRLSVLHCEKCDHDPRDNLGFGSHLHVPRLRLPKEWRQRCRTLHHETLAPSEYSMTFILIW